MNAVRQPASLPLFDSEMTLARLRQSVRGTVRSFAPRAPLARHGQPLSAVHVVLSGLVALTSTSEGGRQAILALIGPGGVVGQESVLAMAGVSIETSLSDPADPEASHVSPVALMVCTTLVLPASELRGAFERDPLIVAWLAATACQRARALERSLIRSLSLPVRERVLDVLLELASTYGERRSRGVTVQIPLSQDAIAALVGATRESVNRALRQLERSGVVSRVDGAYAVRRRDLDQTGEPGVS
jgi:CRP/FNR family cyclic AMP-dependent transcriptional regulator